MITQEKFNKGHKVCGFLTAKVVNDAVLQKYQDTLENQNLFRKGNSYREGAVYDYWFGDTSCAFNFKEKIRLDCVYPIRQANTKLVDELLNEQALNSRKDQILQELRNQ